MFYARPDVEFPWIRAPQIADFRWIRAPQEPETPWIRAPQQDVPGFRVGENGSSINTPGGSDPLATDDLRRRCIDRCTSVVLLSPGRRPVTWDQCMAHCEGRAYFREVQPYIRFPSPPN